MNPQSSSLKKSSSLKDYETYSRNRIHSYIQIENTTATKWKDFINTPELGPEFVYYLDKHKISLESYVYSFTLSAAETPDSKNPTKWTIRKRYVDFVDLSGKINKEFASEKLLKEFLPQLAGSVNDEQAKSSVVPLRNLNAFLMSLIGNEFVRSKSQVLYEFLELSLLTLPEGTGKFKEGYMMKRPGGRYKESRCQIYCSVIFKRWLKRWCVVTNEGIIYCIDVNSTRVRETLLFDRSFQLEFGRKVTGTKRGIILSTSNRKLHLQAEDVFQAIDWIAAIRKAVSECPYVKENRYESFAPVRQPTSQCKWYVDGEGYFSDLCDALLKANKEVFITDWWLSPELYLKRPVRDENDTEFRLDKVLEKIASRGVKVNIILYREVKLALYNDSEYTKRVLQNLSPNIKVMRHPNQILFMWSHHEKMVVIDQSIGFLGGLDLCYGRMDLNSHPLHDPAFEKGEGNTFPGIDFSNSRQADFRNVRDFMTCLVDKHSHPRMPWHDIAMMVIGEPVRDLARHFIQYWNFAEIDLRFRKDRFLAVEAGREPPSSPRSQKQKKQNLFNMTLKGLLQTKQGKEPGTYYRLEEEKVATPKQPDLNKYLAPKVINTNERTVFGNTSNRPSNAPRNFSKITERESEDDESEEETKKDNKGSKSYDPKTRQGNAKFENDQKIGFDSEETALNDDFFDDDFRRRSSSMYSKSLNLKNENINTFLKMDINDPEFYRRRSYSDKKQKYAMRFNKQYNDLQKNIRQKEIHVSNDNEWYMNAPESTKLEAPIINRELANKFSITEEMLLELSYFKGSGASSKGTCSCQILRSASSWCLGLNDWEHKFENSIQVAYLDLIKNAKQFIYIENQFFISSTAGDPVTNEVVRALLFRIKKAYDDKEKFKVIVFLPLLPGFEGEVDNAGSTVLRIQLHWEYMTINRGGTSLYEELVKLGINPDDYIRFYSLRKHEKMNDVPVTEIIYIHSKLMIVDDEIVIMGSANINDRSMQGSRDSEIAIVVEDSEKVPAKINGVATLVPKFAHTLRKELYMEHLGASDEDVDDPLSDILLDKMNKAAERNTEIFRTVFACYPDDNIKKIAEVKDFKARKNLEEYDNLSKEIVGNIVQFPLQFLENDQLSFAMSDKEYYVPAISFT